LLMEAAGIAQKKLNAIYAEAGAKGSKAKQRAMVHSNPDVAFYQGKIAAAKFFAVNILTSVRGRAEGIKAGDRTPIEIADESFSV
ncbi:MAG: acyl-CoA dehydrogenase C-terminal domain-containing protein, partial [Syntrophaceae bacterium]